jgi:hypothetical protein
MQNNLCCVLSPHVLCVNCGEFWCEECWVNPNSHSEKDSFGLCPETQRPVRWANSKVGSPFRIESFG